MIQFPLRSQPHRRHPPLEVPTSEEDDGPHARHEQHLHLGRGDPDDDKGQDQPEASARGAGG